MSGSLDERGEGSRGSGGPSAWSSLCGPSFSQETSPTVPTLIRQPWRCCVPFLAFSPAWDTMGRLVMLLHHGAAKAQD